MIYNVTTMESVTYKQLKQKWMLNPKFKKTYEDLEPEYAITMGIMMKRIEKNISQKEFARRLGTSQSAVARLESGTYNPSLKFLKRVAKALGSELKISLL